MELKEKDFIEIEFTGRTDGEIFDSNVKEDLESANLSVKPKPFIFCLGQGMFLKGAEDFLIGKDIGVHEVELEPEKAFGKRDSKLIQMIPIKVFKEHNLNPVQGAVFNFDGRFAKVLTISGGRVIVDFNHSLAGKTLSYKINVLRKVDDLNEKIKSFNKFLFKRDFEFEVKDKKMIIKADEKFGKFIEIFKNKYKEIFDLDLEVVKEEPKD